ncbi:MAG: transporter substrate-binding domain-containing protein [Thiothrix sp.]|nr:transporter substrate-binding domain-containing protein [Thiothrix sp.]
MTKKWVVSIALAALLSTPVLQAQDTLRIATEGAYAPWNFVNDEGKLAGFEVDLGNELCKRLEAKCEFIQNEWDSIIPNLIAGNYDAIMAGMSITDERLEVIDFSRSYATTPAIFVAPKDSDFAAAGLPETRVDMTEISAEEQALLDQVKGLLDGLTVGVQTATIHENFLREHMGDIDIRTYDSQENLDLDLQAGRIDVALADQSGWQPLLEGELGEDFTRVGPGFARGIFGRGVGVGIRKEDAALKDKFNAAIQSALDDGTVSELAIKWFGFDSATTD